MTTTEHSSAEAEAEEPTFSQAEAAVDLVAESKEYFSARGKIASGEVAEQMAAQRETEPREADADLAKRAELSRDGHSILSNTSEAQDARTRIAELWNEVPDSAYGPEQQTQPASGESTPKREAKPSRLQKLRRSSGNITDYLKPRLPRWLRFR